MTTHLWKLLQPALTRDRQDWFLDHGFAIGTRFLNRKDPSSGWILVVKMPRRGLRSLVNHALTVWAEGMERAQREHELGAWSEEQRETGAKRLAEGREEWEGTLAQCERPVIASTIS
ncbi:hypothetical protein CL629_00405 [bacterium]|nr:hypothetical protein [bacterium]|tara:strand:- start:2063 stop:2413 length:351 start_codon:yes stop_codon:yes gene_type:complete